MVFIRRLYDRYRELIVYAIFGALTTAVNFLVYFPLDHIQVMPSGTVNAIAWLVSVLFAFFTNKPFVFHSNDWSLRVTAPEFLRFTGSRIGSGLLDTGCIFLFVDILHLNSAAIKLIVSVAVVIINYIASKLTFHKQTRQG